MKSLVSNDVAHEFDYRLNISIECGPSLTKDTYQSDSRESKSTTSTLPVLACPKQKNVWQTCAGDPTAYRSYPCACVYLRSSRRQQYSTGAVAPNVEGGLQEAGHCTHVRPFIMLGLTLKSDCVKLEVMLSSASVRTVVVVRRVGRSGGREGSSRGIVGGGRGIGRDIADCCCGHGRRSVACVQG